MRNRLNFIKRVLYRLRHLYGVTASLVEVSNITTNYETGVQEITTTTHTINKIIKLPRQTSSFARTLATLGILNRGGESDKTVTDFIIDARILPSGVVPSLREQYIIVNEQRFNIKSVEELDDNLGYWLQTEAYEGMEQ